MNPVWTEQIRKLQTTRKPFLPPKTQNRKSLQLKGLEDLSTAKLQKILEKLNTIKDMVTQHSSSQARGDLKRLKERIKMVEKVLSTKAKVSPSTVSTPKKPKGFSWKKLLSPLLITSIFLGGALSKPIVKQVDRFGSYDLYDTRASYDKKMGEHIKSIERENPGYRFVSMTANPHIASAFNTVGAAMDLTMGMLGVANSKARNALDYSKTATLIFEPSTEPQTDIIVKTVDPSGYLSRETYETSLSNTIEEMEEKGYEFVSITSHPSYYMTKSLVFREKS
jgi:hypothetical protein